MNQHQQTLYERVGGDETFRQIVDTFYDRIEHDPLLRPLFPDDLEEGKRWQFLFLTQYWGGPARYQQERGHPRLRMRHAPFKIGRKEAEAWLGHMIAAIDDVGIEAPERTQLVEYFRRAAMFLINQPEDA